MESCLLCLEANKDTLGCIKSDSTQWTDQNITIIIEKHFWPLNNIHFISCICLSCWRAVEDFHNFYLRIEETHSNSSQIKVENFSWALKCKDELSIENSSNTDDGDEEKYKMNFCVIEPEVLIDQTQKRDFTEREIFIDSNTSLGMNVEKTTVISEFSDDLDNVPLIYACQQLKVEENSKDPLEKSKTCKKKRSPKEKLCTKEKFAESDKAYEFRVKDEPLDLNDDKNDSNNVNDKYVNCKAEKSSLEISDSRGHKANNKNDKFIAEHFKQMLCDICQVPFENFPAMQKHFIDNHKQYGYVVCCKRKFFRRTRLVDHLRCHLNPDHFKCNDCGKVMSDRSCFHNHMLRVHRANEVVKKHNCDMCGKSFTKAYVLRIHKLSHLPEEEKKFPCTECGKNYGSSYLLNQHRQVVHLKRFVKVCYICGKSTNSSAEFKVHMDKHEGTAPPVINCDVCGLRLTSERGLKLHKESQHPIGGKQEHHCSICQRVSPTLKALQKHINTMHKKGYDHKCSICEKAFKRAEALREHVATHTGTTLYTCPWCPKTFNSNGNMHAHRKKIHPKEWEQSKRQRYSSNILPEI